MKRTRQFIGILVIALMTISIQSAGKTGESDKSLPPGEKETIVQISTEFGDIKIKLYNETPKHRDNFIKLVNEGLYDSTLFHRVIQNFMIQGGDPDSKNAKSGVQLGNGGPGYTIPAEFIEGIYHKKGALAAAREGDDVNPEKASSGSQFYLVQGKIFTPEEMAMYETKMQQNAVFGFARDYLMKPENAALKAKVDSLQSCRAMPEINKIIKEIEEDNKEEIAKIEIPSFTKEQVEIYTTVGGTPHLDGAYTVFGEVIEGLDVIDAIAALEKDKNNRPISDTPMTITIIN